MASYSMNSTVYMADDVGWLWSAFYLSRNYTLVLLSTALGQEQTCNRAVFKQVSEIIVPVMNI